MMDTYQQMDLFHDNDDPPTAGLLILYDHQTPGAKGFSFNAYEISCDILLKSGTIGLFR